MAGFIFADTATIDGAELRALFGAFLSKPSPRPMGAFTGLPAGAGTVVAATSSGLVWTVHPHVGVIDGETPAAAGPYPYGFDSDVTGNYNAADSSHDRLDLLSVQIDDPAEGDGTGSEMPVIVYTPGTAASSPSLPSGPARSMNLAQIRVPAGGGTPVVTMIAPFTVASGGVMPCVNSSMYPANPYLGQPIFNIAAKTFYFWDGSDWLPYANQKAKCRVSRTASLGGVDADGSRPGTWSASTIRGTAFSVSAGAVIDAVGGDRHWFVSASFPSGSGEVEAWVEVNGTVFSTGRDTRQLSGTHQTWLSTSGPIELSPGDSVQIVLAYLDGTLATPNGNLISFCLEAA